MATPCSSLDADASQGEYQDAKDFADEKLVTLASGLTPEKQLNPDDREVYLAAKKKVEPFKTSINEALQEWSEAKKALNDRVGLAEVVESTVCAASDDPAA